MTKEELTLAIKALIKPNGNEEITGQILQDKLLQIVDEMWGISHDINPKLGANLNGDGKLIKNLGKGTDPNDAARLVDLEEAAGVVEVSGTGNLTYNVPDGKLLEKIVIISAQGNNNFSVGTTNGGDDVLPAIPVSAVDKIDLNFYANGAPEPIWFNGINSQTTIKMYIR